MKVICYLVVFVTSLTLKYELDNTKRTYLLKVSGYDDYGVQKYGTKIKKMKYCFVIYLF